ncbi:gustatory receptor for sugar taste 64f-like [Aphidius gifuensis]|uniref:gustatory receptor for sugar taste 64f-like n=1 Tax=Aphidius gifuensis TaxID=684658 RepID=UPI001CDD1CC3|nr:gustatory receptor for sugar taste 64f-like [Aphidius gifuensis]
MSARSDEKSIWQPESFHKSIGPILAISQSFGLLPVSGVCTDNSNKLSFRIVGAILGCVFYGSIFTEYLIFFYLPTKWIKLQQEWQLMEIQLNKFNNNCPKLRWKFNTITIVMILLSTIEHIRRIVEIMAMKEDPKFFVNMAEEIFLFVINIYTSYIWNFTDLFIMLVSTGLAERYKFLNNIVINTTIWNNHENYWDQLRICYGKLSKLVKNTDQVISPLIFISCTHYFFLICLQLLLWISRDDTVTFAAVFPFFSFGFMVFSTNAVMFSASRINDHSKKILPTVYECPSVEYTNEAKRLQDQMTSDDITLTGLNFFSITRNFMLAVAGTMVTYEIVLLQFSDPKKGVY